MIGHLLGAAGAVEAVATIQVLLSHNSSKFAAAAVQLLSSFLCNISSNYFLA